MFNLLAGKLLMESQRSHVSQSEVLIFSFQICLVHIMYRVCMGFRYWIVCIGAMNNGRNEYALPRQRARHRIIRVEMSILLFYILQNLLHNIKC